MSARLDTADLTIVGGAGHVGIPLVLAFAEAGHRVNVHDVNREALETLRSGRLPFIEHGGEELLVRALKRNRLVFTSSPAGVSPTGPIIVTIGTPIDEFLNPVRKVVQDCIDGLLPYLADGQLLVLRSTVFPGTTDWLDGYLRRKNRDLKEKGARICGISAPSRASTLVNYLGLDEAIIDYVCEIAGSLKIGKCMPGTSIPVVEESRLFSDQPECAVIFSWHIADELAPKLRTQGYCGKLLTPLPVPREL